MVQFKNNSRKNMAMSLRRGGYSYAEIQKFVSVPKATLNYWFKEIKLSEPQTDRLKKKRSEAARAGTKIRSENILKTIEQIEKDSASSIGKISKRELWLMGVMLYWRNRNKNDVRKGVQFMSGDPNLIRLFLKWLKEIGQLPEEEIAFDIFSSIRKKGKKAQSDVQKVINFWSDQTGFSRGHFNHLYHHANRSEFGLLRIRVKASSMLARQLSGWIKGIQEITKPS